MSLEIIEYTYEDANSVNEIIATIKQRTGVELEATGGENYEVRPYNVRFPDMETAQSVKLGYLTYSGTFFIDLDNHFLCYTIHSGTEKYNYVDDLYRVLIFDYNGKLANVCYTRDPVWTSTMNIADQSGNYDYYTEDDSSKSNITLCPLRVKAYNDLNDAGTVKTFVKNCYVNYERKFQKNLKFIDQNGNRFVTLGGYLLYKVD